MKIKILQKRTFVDIQREQVDPAILSELDARQSYTDMHYGLQEDIYSIDHLELGPKSRALALLISQIRKQAPKAEYFRLVNTKNWYTGGSVKPNRYDHTTP